MSIKRVIKNNLFHCQNYSIFYLGAVFESTLNPDTRRKGGMHYTSIENIHKAIDPLFLDELKAELNEMAANAGENATPRQKKDGKNQLLKFQNKLSSLKFLDPACGSGNFLTETYLSLRRLENEVLKLIYGNERLFGDIIDPIKVRISQFYGIEINDFAWRTFRWDSESSGKAHVHCVIIGFSCTENNKPKTIYDGGNRIAASNINAYLIDAENIFVESRKKPLCDVPEMLKGSSPVDGGHLIIEEEDYEDFVKKAPQAKKYIRQFVGAAEFIQGKKRYCLWLDGAEPNDINGIAAIRQRVEAVRNFRLSSTKEATRRFADYPARFMEIRQPKTDYILIPRHSSESRRYIPIGFLSPECIASDANIVIPNAGLYEFGILSSNVHMAWVRMVCGRLEMRYRYSNDIVYNNFPWPNPTAEQRKRIEATAQAILDARKLSPNSTLSALYGPVSMPPELLAAHRSNDKAVMQAYGLDIKTTSEPQCVAFMMKRYREMAEKSLH